MEDEEGDDVADGGVAETVGVGVQEFGGPVEELVEAGACGCVRLGCGGGGWRRGLGGSVGTARGKATEGTEDGGTHFFFPFWRWMLVK